MSRTVFDLEGRVGLEDKNFLAKAKRVKQALADLRATSQKVSSGGANLRKTTKEYQTLEKEIKQAEKTLNDLNKTKARQAAAHKRSDEYKAMQKDIVAAEAELDRLIEEQISLADMPRNSYFEQLDEQIERSRAKLEEMKAGLKAMAETGATEEEAQDWFRTADAIDKAEAELRQYKAQQATMVKNGSAYEKASQAGIGRSFGKKALAGLKSIGAGLGGLIKPQKRVSNGFKNISRQAAKMKKGLFMGAGIRGLVRLGVAGAIALYSIRMLKQGLENLRQYDARTNASLNQMTASLTTLKNALATAFAPILNVIVPILSQFIDWLVAGITAIAHFMAALTGQSQVTVARKAISGVGSAAGGAAGSLGDANDAAKEYQRTLMGFDQINKLEDPTSGSGGGGSGGGGGGGAAGSGSMFETVPVDSLMADWADKIKEAWENADFTEIGSIVGEKLNHALESIPWDKIKATSAKIAKSIATFLNGFIETVDWQLVGKTFAEGINTIIEFGYSFVTNFHWGSFGQAIGNAVTGFVTNLDLKKAAQTLSELLKGMLDTAINALETIDFRAIGEKIVEFVTNIDYAGIAVKIIQLLGDALIGAFDLLDGVMTGLSDKLAELLSQGADALGDMAGEKISVGVSLVKSGWTSLKDWVGDKISAAVSLVKSGWTSIKAFVGDSLTAAVKLAKSGWSSIAGFVGTVVSVGIKLFKSGWSSISSFVGTTVKVGIKLIKSGWKTIKKFLGLKGGGIFSLNGKKVSKMKADGGMVTGGSWKPITAAANGGAFSHGQMFIAREKGPELVGTLNGHTAVMNNNQIVSSVAAGVAQAVASVMQNVDFSRGDTTVYLEGDAAKFFRVMQQAAIDYTRATGLPAFPV